MVSDGTDTPTEVVANAAARGLGALALTDHDTFDGLAEAQAAGERLGIEVVPGMELSCSRAGQSVHLLAYGADPTDAALAAELVLVRSGRSGRLRPVLAKLAELGVPVTEEAVLSFVGTSPSVGRPHIADALVAAGHVRDRKEAFDRFLADGGPAHVTRYTIDVAHGIDLVHGAGGVAVIAHPWGRGREAVLPPEVLAGLVAEQRVGRFRGRPPRSRRVDTGRAADTGRTARGAGDGIERLSRHGQARPRSRSERHRPRDVRQVAGADGPSRGDPLTDAACRCGAPLTPLGRMSG